MSEREYEVRFEQFDYLFNSRTESRCDYFRAESIEQAAALARWKHGDAISIVSVEVFE